MTSRRGVSSEGFVELFCREGGIFEVLGAQRMVVGWDFVGVTTIHCMMNGWASLQ